MPLNARQTGAVKDLLRRSAELVEDAQHIAAKAADHSKVASLKALRLNLADEIAELAKNG